MKYELRRLSFGETLGQAFNLYFDNFVPLFMISLVCSIPTILFMHSTGIGTGGNTTINPYLSRLILILLSLTMTTICTALTIELISKRYLKQHQDIARYIENVLPFILPIIGLSILEGIIIGLGLLAFLIPGIYLALAVSVAVQVLIVEHQGIMESMRRSFFLTRGKKLEIFGYWLIIILIGLAVNELREMTAGLIVQLDAALQTKLILFYGIYYLVNILITPIGSCIFILIYFNLKIEKEGFDLEHLVDQFGTSSPMTNDQ